jgi:hypothetical protein
MTDKLVNKARYLSQMEVRNTHIWWNNAKDSRNKLTNKKERPRDSDWLVKRKKERDSQRKKQKEND